MTRQAFWDRDGCLWERQGVWARVVWIPDVPADVLDDAQEWTIYDAANLFGPLVAAA